MSINDILEKYGTYLGICAGFIVAFLATFTSFWQLAIVAGIIGGIFCIKTKLGALVGSLGVGLAWLVYVIIKALTTQVIALFDQVGSIIIGSTGLGIVFVILVVVIGFLFGLIGGYLGSSIRVLFDFLMNRKDTPDSKPAEVPANP